MSMPETLATAIKNRVLFDVFFEECQRALIAGKQPVNLRHSLKVNFNLDVHDVWSEAITVPVGAPVSFALQSLPWARPTDYKDLYTNQRVCWFSAWCISDSGGGMLHPKHGSDIMTTILISPGAVSCSVNPNVHLFGQHIDTFELMALTGEFEVEVIVATTATAP